MFNIHTSRTQTNIIYNIIKECVCVYTFWHLYDHGCRSNVTRPCRCGHSEPMTRLQSVYTPREIDTLLFLMRACSAAAAVRMLLYPLDM